MLKEGHQRSSHRHNLCRRHIHILNPLGTHHDGLAGLACRNQFAGQSTVLVQCRVGLGNDVFAFFNGRQIVDVHRYLAIGHAAIRCFNKTVFIQAGIQRQGIDQANVRAFGRFNRAHPAIVGDVHVTYFKTSTLTRQTPWAKGRNTALMGDFRQGIGLIHELRQLRGTKKFFERC
ncbi:hypothetical protein GALL_503360 [mine drainage metagenome]|uniref:Uncharacterized protein n=1 Tax=mine drainage metagenome TaxID=410659 RepID=A0A1J5PWS9_9ZZZZ